MLESVYVTVDDGDFGTDIHDMYKTPINGDYWPSHVFITQSQAASSLLSPN